jgi:hypothetical protein
MIGAHEGNTGSSQGSRCEAQIGPNLAQARKVALETTGAAADNHAADVLPIIREIRKAGATTLREIADPLNARGVATAQGRVAVVCYDCE